jgi:MFS family permease
VALRESVSALSHRNFRLLYLARTVSLVGDGLAPVALAFAVLDATGSAGDLGIVLAARSLVLVAFLLSGGVVADRMSPRRAMLVADFARMVVMGLMGAVLVAGTARIWELALLYAMEGIGTALFNPASNALVPIVVPQPQLQGANGLLSLSKSIGKVVGPLIAGVLLVVGSPGMAIIVDAATFGISGFFLLRIVAKKVRPTETTSFVHDLREGWTEFSSRRWLVACVAAAACTNAIFFPAFLVLGPTVAREALGGSGAWVLIASAFGVGTVAGGAIGILIRARRPLLVSQVSVFIFVLPLLLLASEVSPVVIAFGALLAGAALSVAEVLYGTTIQEQIPAQAMARVSAYDWFGSLALQPVGFALAGTLAAGIGNSRLLLGEAALLVCTQGAAILVPSVRRLERPPESRPMPPPVSTVAPEDIYSSDV